LRRILAIAEGDFGAGLALTGIDVQRAQSASEAREALLRAVDGQDYGIVIVEERFTSEFDAKTEALIADTNVPLIVSLPAEMKWRDAEEPSQDDYVASLVRRAVGYQLNIQT